MERGDADAGADDGIVAEDVTQLVEHIELTGAHPLPDAPDWELATPASDLEDAPILIGSLPDEPPRLADDPELFTETRADLEPLELPARRAADRAGALAAERARWQRRVDELERLLAERDQMIAERDHRIEELQARLAARTLEREGLAAELQAAQPNTGAEFRETAMLEPEQAPVEARDAPVADPAGSAPDAADYTLEMPKTELPPPLSSPGPEAAPRLRRYLIGLDLVGCVHEVIGRISVGRTRDNDLRIVDPTVSRLHAMLTIRNGVAMLVDANSRNGIFVNGIQVRYARLDDGDLVTFGTVRFRYRVGSDAAGAALASA